MVTQHARRGEARDQLLDTAEELFASQGVGAVSLRTINAAAGVSAGVLHYHFGSREVLIAELITRNMNELALRRQQRLEALLVRARPDIRDVIEAMVLPLAEFIVTGGESGKRYVRFISRLYAERSTILGEVSHHYRSVNQLYFKLLRKSLPQLDNATLNLRASAANHAMLQSLADMASETRVWVNLANTHISGEQQVAKLVDFITAGFAAQAQQEKS